MASDASRRWLDGSGIWSCRIKLPQSHAEHSEHHHHLPPQMPATDHYDMNDPAPREPASPNARRKGKIAEALQSMADLNNSMESLDMPTDPDAQATVTDFLDFTEYLPSDMIRSLTLIGNLDRTYARASANVHEHTKTWARLRDPELRAMPAEERPDPIQLREDISLTLGEAVGARTLSHAEAIRMAENVARHYSRAKNILAKLQGIADNYPPSREPSPAVQKAKSPVANRGPKITLRLDGSRSQAPGGRPHVRKHRAPRITVPGEVLAPYELDYESYGSETSESDSEDESVASPRATPGRSLGAPSGKIRLKISKPKKERAPKPPRGPRPPGVMGTNVHSAIAGISTSNALAQLSPPPPTAVKGDKDLPWLQLNAWELAHLRKRMKKNAIWSPSDTMIARELATRGRGIEAYRVAKAAAAAEGVPFDESHEPPQLRGETVYAEGAISVDAVKREEPQTSNRGMVLNQAKKLKREIEAKELAKQAAEEAEQSASKLVEAAKVMKGLFEKSPNKDGKEKKGLTKTPSKSKKRKRESPPVEAITEHPPLGEPAQRSTNPPSKRSKTETPVPLPHIAPRRTPSIATTEHTPSVASEPAQAMTPSEQSSEALGIPPSAPSPKKSSTPILPPVRESRRSVKKENKQLESEKPEPTPTAANSRSRRTPIVPLPASTSVTAAIAGSPEPLPSKRPSSSRSKAASEPEPHTPIVAASSDRPRRTSTARNTPAPEPRQPSKRAKRPAPGVVTADSEGSTAVSVGRRKAATRKKAGMGIKKEKKDGRESSVNLVEIDDEGNVIDPNEARYCVCNRVSFGTMIGCENTDCEKEWFHLECVGLTDIPPRTTKWYCPECRVTLGIGEKGEVNARGKKK